MSTSASLRHSRLFLNWKGMAPMVNLRTLTIFAVVAALSFASVAAAHADTLKQITSSSAQGADDSLVWSQKGADGTTMAASFSATTTKSKSVTVDMGAANSIISVVCSASPCSWTGATSGFTAGDSLLWSSDTGNGGSGPVTLTFLHSVAGAGAVIQADLPGAFTGQIQVYNGATLLATYTVASDTAGDPVYLGAFDDSGANISKVVFSLTSCASLCTDFGLDTVHVNTSSTTPASLTSPTPSSTLAGSNVTFNWTTAPAATGYTLRLGTTVGGNDIRGTGVITATSVNFAPLPTNGETIHARLYTFFPSSTSYADYVYTAASNTPAALISPAPNSTLTSSNVTFSWSAGTGATSYNLRLGTTVGGNDIRGTGNITGTSVTFSPLPTNGETIHARLTTNYASGSAYTDYALTAANNAQAVLISPAPNSTLTSSNVTFSWSAGTGAVGYVLRLGTTVGGNDIRGTGKITSTSITFAPLPVNGETIHVRLYTLYASGSAYTDYVVTAKP
jgi:hypothetical protein